MSRPFLIVIGLALVVLIKLITAKRYKVSFKGKTYTKTKYLNSNTYELRRYYQKGMRPLLISVHTYQNKELIKLEHFKDGRLIKLQQGEFNTFNILKNGSENIYMPGMIYYTKKSLVKGKLVKIEKIEKKYLLNLSSVDQMSGRTFELFLEYLFLKQGYKGMATSCSSDHGVDLILRDQENRRIGIQAKRSNSKIGKTAVQEILNAHKIENFNKKYIITNNYFLPSAVEYAQENKVDLINRDQLVQLMKK